MAKPKLPSLLVGLSAEPTAVLSHYLGLASAASSFKHEGRSIIRGHEYQI